MIKSLGMFAVVAVAALCASPAMAIVGDRVRIINNNNAVPFHLAEVRVFESGTGINVASQTNGGIASTFNTTSTNGTVPGDANDNNTNGAFAGGSVWHSEAGANKGWQVDLAGLARLDAAQIFGRTDGCCLNRDDDLTLIVFRNGALVHSQDFGITGGTVANLSLPVPEPTSMALLGLAGAGLAARRRRRAVA